MIKYSNGQQFKKTETETSKKPKKFGSFSHGNRGMNLENDINLSNDYYKQIGKCLVTKRPTPINVVKVDYSCGQKIVDAYFEKQSTTDYNGVYKSRYLDFEAKSTLKTTSFPLANITYHQIDHLKNVIKHGGIAFFIIEFQKLKEVYLLDASYVIEFYEFGKRKSIPYKEIKDNGNLIKNGLTPRLDYIDVVEKIYIKS